MHQTASDMYAQICEAGKVAKTKLPNNEEDSDFSGQLSYSLNSIKGDYIRDDYKAFQEDIRHFDYSCSVEFAMAVYRKVNRYPRASTLL